MLLDTWITSSFCGGGTCVSVCVGESHCVEVNLGDSMFKQSTFCGSGACVQVDTDFKKSSYSGAAGHCVEVERNPNVIQVRDSKLENSPILSYTREEWDAFIKGVKAGEFDLE